jgi:hypothetical protein
MKVIIDIPKDTYEYYLKLVANDDVMNNPEKIIVNGTPINNNATNGDMLKAMFPNQTISCSIPITDRNGAKFYRTTINGVTDFTEDWWNAPYKAESER